MDSPHANTTCSAISRRRCGSFCCALSFSSGRTNSWMATPAATMMQATDKRTNPRTQKGFAPSLEVPTAPVGSGTPVSPTWRTLFLSKYDDWRLLPDDAGSSPRFAIVSALSSLRRKIRRQVPALPMFLFLRRIAARKYSPSSSDESWPQLTVERFKNLDFWRFC